ncbi:MAG: hypothetical protein ABW245_06750, partial [Gaiellaceae bacterium]
QRLPTVDEVRPARCPICGAVSSPVGGPLLLHGHGTRERSLSGPLDPGQPPVLVDLLARRYRCVPCTAVLTVVPCSVLARRRYSAAAIAYALALWGLVLASASEVRRQVNPAKRVGPTAAAGWAMLRRWARAVKQRRLFATTPLPPSSTWRSVAASAAAALAGRAAPASRTRPLEQRAFAAAARPAGWA